MIDSKNETVYFNKGFIYENLDNINKAIENYSKVIEINSKNSRAYLVRGDLYSKIKENVKAINDYTKAIELQPDYIYSYGARGINYFNINEYNSALENFDQYLNNIKWQLGVNSFDLRVLYYRAFTYIYTKDFDKSLNGWNQYLKIDNFYPYAFRHRGLVYLLLNNYSKALEDFNTAISFNNLDSRLYYLSIITSYKISENEYKNKLNEFKSIKIELKEDWEKLVLDFFMDKITSDELLSKVENKFLKFNVFCYIGYKYLINGNKELAKTYFKKCFETKESAPIEYVLSLYEYEKL